MKKRKVSDRRDQRETSNELASGAREAADERRAHLLVIRLRSVDDCSTSEEGEEASEEILTTEGLM